MRRKFYFNRPSNYGTEPRFRQPFQKEPSGRFKDGRRPGYKFNRNNLYFKKSDRYKHNTSNHREGRHSKSAEEESSLISVTDLHLYLSEISTEVLNLNLQYMYIPLCDPFRGGDN